jgi:hypothetical protein
MYSANSKLFASAARSLEINSSRVPLEVSRREPRSELGTPLGIRKQPVNTTGLREGCGA